ncbi:MAG: Gfo/Idh/MocA family oxidoreductase [Stappiaceae bacterium]
MTSTPPFKVAIVGVGKIARDQHIPAIAANADFELAATVSGSGGIGGVENYSAIEDLLEAREDITCVALCNPPQVRYAIATKALAARRHVLLEKPPGATLSEVEALRELAAMQDVSLFATWHSRHAPSVSTAKDWLKSRNIKRVSVIWKEDVKHWHPGQKWIWEAGGLGVFDPGINALSIITEILPDPMHLTGASLEFPANCETPIAAKLAFTDAKQAMIEADFDWRQTGPQSWDIHIETDQGRLDLSKGGSDLTIDGGPVPVGSKEEYPEIYKKFASLLTSGTSDVDIAPLRHVADSFMLGKRLVTDAFFDDGNTD